ncbi:MAG: hypothetical protein RJA70_4916 [Pseudomonadota bacterium]|jgi:hypothetical protein
MGFTLHAATNAPRHDLRAKEALLRYVLRPALAQLRVTLSADGSVRLALKRAFSDGTVAVELDPLSFLCRLAAAIPGPGFHTVRCGGILSSAAKWRPMQLKAFLVSPQCLRRLLRTRSEATHAPQRAPPRPPPYFTGQPRRHRKHDPGSHTQGVLF